MYKNDSKKRTYVQIVNRNEFLNELQVRKTSIMWYYMHDTDSVWLMKLLMASSSVWSLKSSASCIVNGDLMLSVRYDTGCLLVWSLWHLVVLEDIRISSWYSLPSLWSYCLVGSQYRHRQLQAKVYLKSMDVHQVGFWDLLSENRSNIPRSQQIPWHHVVCPLA